MNAHLQALVAEIAAAPHSAAALTLYALVSTLEYEQAGCLYRLLKLRDLSGPQRQLAYHLMDLMAEGHNKGEHWDQAKAQIDTLVRDG